MPHRDKAHTFSGKLVKVKDGQYTDKEFLVDDWLERVDVRPGYFVLPQFVDTERIRIRDEGYSPKENDLIYGTIGGKAFIFHQDQLDLELSRSKVPNE